MTSHYFSDQAKARPEELREIRVRLAGRDLALQVADGVFAASGLDKATALLLDQVPPPPPGPVLDLGCGWGPIALAAAIANPAADVWAVDVNTRALDLAARNARIAGAGNIHVCEANQAREAARAEGVRFQAIWSNPPVRIGKEALHTLLLDWLDLLAEDGEAWFVVGKNLGADSLATWLSGEGYPTRKVASKRGFRVMVSQRTPA